MKKLILIPILLCAIFASAASFPVFIGNQFNYITNNGSTLVVFITNSPIIGYKFNQIIGFVPVSIANTLDVSGTTTLGRLDANSASTRGFSLIVTNVAGIGGANTNFTLYAKQGFAAIDGGTTNVNIVAIMGGDSQNAWEGSFMVTNRTGTDRQLSFGTSTNAWQSVTHYDGVITNGETLTITNGTAISVWWRLIGSNILYAAKHTTLPAP